MLSSPRSRRRLLWLVGIVGALTAVVLVVLHVVHDRTRDISHPNVEFSAPTVPPPAPRPATAKDPNFTWPMFGYSGARTNNLELRHPLHPPFLLRWKRGGSVLIEFPPVLDGRALFVLKDDGGLSALSRRTGQTLWARRFGSLAASSPAVGHHTLYITLLQRFRNARGGRIVAVDEATGRTRWSRKLASRSESSPLLADGMVIFGQQNGSVYALNAANGRIRWRFRASGAVKSGLTTDGDGRVFFGDYSGHVYALRLRNGHKLWRVGTSGAGFGFHSGQFYSTPAAAYGRVYLGNTDGFVYSFATRNGKLAWRTHTGGYVYGSPAIAQLPHGHPTVYVGSYDHRLYAFDARSGRPRWIRKTPGRISGTAVVLGDLVWFSTLNHWTEALRAGTGRPVYVAHRGAFSPAVSDGQRIYMLSATSIYAVTPYRPRRRH